MARAMGSVYMLTVPGTVKNLTASFKLPQSETAYSNY